MSTGNDWSGKYVRLIAVVAVLGMLAFSSGSPDVSADPLSCEDLRDVGCQFALSPEEQRALDEATRRSIEEKAQEAYRSELLPKVGPMLGPLVVLVLSMLGTLARTAADLLETGGDRVFCRNCQGWVYPKSDEAGHSVCPQCLCSDLSKSRAS